MVIMAAAVSFLTAPVTGFAQETEAVEAVAADAAVEGAVVADAAPAFEHYGADMIVGQPVSANEDMLASMTFQPQHTANGDYALWMHDAILMPVITVISLFVLGLLLWVVARYRRSRNPVASKTSHNTLIEIIWTVIPVIILLVIAVPSITLLARQYQSPPEDALTIKANGYQWYWGYEYVDNGGFEVISNMLSDEDALSSGEPHQLAVDNRMVVPVGVPIRIQTFGKDVIHAFGVPSLWFKMDAVPGRINEKMLQIDEPGIYYGQCMELCGARHGYMPIAIEARPVAEYEAWVLSQGGTLPGAVAAVPAEPAAAPAPEAEVAVPAEEIAAADAAQAQS
ncbi:cytochrome c oxidase subunit II [Alteraurantiacibacter aestuarii]